MILRDGSVTLVRRVQPADFNGLLRFLDGLSLRSRYLRFCSGGANLGAAARVATQASDRRFGVVACDLQGDIVAHAEYAVTAPGEAEVAVVVADRLQSRGMARDLIGRLAAEAGARGMRRFLATVLPENAPMLALFRRAFGATVKDSPIECAVSFPVSPSTTARQAA